MSHRHREKPRQQQVVDAILEAYRRGYFPMSEGPPPWNPFAKPQIHWFSPDPRGVLPLTPDQGFHASRSLERKIRANWFDIRLDTDFQGVMLGCAQPRTPTPDAPDNDKTWIDQTLVDWFTLLFQKGHAHSIEAWRNDPESGKHVLVGGVYGLSIGAAFFGESMFHVPRPRLPNPDESSPLPRHPLDGTDASKVCLTLLVRALHRAGYTLFDTQMVTRHVSTLGGVDIPRRDYLMRLRKATAAEDRWPGVKIEP